MTTTQPPDGLQPTVESLTRRVRRGLRDYVSELKMFSRNARLYLTGIFLVWLNFQVFMLLFNLYLRELGYVEGDIGWINSSRAIGMSVMALPAAWVISRIRLKPVLLVGCLLLTLFSFAMCTFDLFFVIFSFSVLSGAMLAAIRVAAGPFFMRNSTRKERTLLFSAAFAVHVLAGMAASGGAGEMVTAFDGVIGDIVLSYRYTLYVGIIFSLAAFIPLALIKASDPSSEENRIDLSWRQLKERGRFYVRITLANFLVGLGAGLVIPFLNLFFRDRFNLSPDTIGWFYFCVTGSMFLGTMVGPILTKKFGLVRTVVITQLASMPFMLVLSYSYILPLVFVAFVIRGGLMNLGIPIVTNFTLELCRKNEQGLVNALLMLSWTSSWMVSTAVGGSMIESYGYTVTFNTTIILYVVSSLIYFWFFRKSEKRKDTGSGYVVIPDQSR
jgi:predicted MFS family arabinose efflux permease